MTSHTINIASGDFGDIVQAGDIHGDLIIGDGEPTIVIRSHGTTDEDSN